MLSICIPPRVELVVARRAFSQTSALITSYDVFSETSIDGLCYGIADDSHCDCSSKSEEGENGFDGIRPICLHSRPTCLLSGTTYLQSVAAGNGRGSSG